MKISTIEAFYLRSTKAREFPNPIASYVTDGSIFLKVNTSEGIHGIGEASPYGGPLKEIKRTLETIVSAEFIGKSPWEALPLTSQNVIPEKVGYGAASYNCVIAGFSQALWDIIGKAEGKPVCRLLNQDNEEVNPVIRTYASGGMFYETPSPSAMIEEVLRVKEEGFTAWKLRPYTPLKAPSSHLERNKMPPEIDINSFISLLEQIRLAVGDEMELMVDAGCRLKTIDEALKVSRVLEELSFSFFEEPIPRNIHDYIQLRQSVHVPIAGGECFVSNEQIKPWVDSGALDILQPDSNLAGITEIVKMSEYAGPKGLPLIMHNWANDVSTAANLHVAFAQPNCTLVEYNITHNPMRNELVDDPYTPVRGYFHLRDKPGLGIELCEEALNKFAF